MTTKGYYATQAAAGTTQATAATLVADRVTVTTITPGSAEGVILTAVSVGEKLTVCNGSSTDNLFVYPRVGGRINNATVNASLELPPNRAAQFEAVSGLDVVAIF